MAKLKTNLVKNVLKDSDEQVDKTLLPSLQFKISCNCKENNLDKMQCQNHCDQSFNTSNDTNIT